MKDYWFTTPEQLGDDASKAFASLESIWALSGEPVTASSLCAVERIELDGCGYYVKKYSRAGKGVAEFVGRSKACMEWQNLQRFQQWGLPVAKVVCCGEESLLSIPRRGVVVTEELKGTSDLKALADKNSPLLKSRRWVEKLLPQVASATRKMHSQRFAHNDLKWRNLLVTIDTAEPQLFLIDCPSGRFWKQPFLQYRRIKDLACLDGVAKQVLSRTQRLRYYKLYKGIKRLNSRHKREITKITGYRELE